MLAVSVIIPTYNREKYVGNAIDSVLGQTFKNHEIIIVDDGSTDNTKENLGRYRDKITYIYQDNAGVSAARNTGIKRAQGEWLAFLDSDDEWRADYLYKQMEKAQGNPGLCMQTADCLFIGLNGDTRRYFEINRSLGEFRGRDYLLPEEPFQFVVKHGPWQIGSTIIRHEAIRKGGLFDTSLRLSEDLEFMARMALQGSFGMINETLVSIYRRNESTECLTNQVKANPIKARLNDEEIFENLKEIETLRDAERNALKGIIGANRRAIGNLFIKDGNVKKARESYRRALLADKSIASLGKLFITFLPKGICLRLLEKTINLKKRQSFD